MFCASLYNKNRQDIFQRILGEARQHDIEIESPVDAKELTLRFEELSECLEKYDAKGHAIAERSAISEEIFRVRKEIWLAYLGQISRARAVVSMPGFFKGLPGRISEASIVHTPTIIIDSKLGHDHRKRLKTEGLFFANSKRIRFLKRITNSKISPPTTRYLDSMADLMKKVGDLHEQNQKHR